MILSVSRLAQYKGHETVMRAVSLLGGRFPVSYVIVGDGPGRQSLEGSAQRLGIQDHVHFAGKIPDHELPSFYAMADVFVLCTEERKHEASVEGFGVVFLEAAAAGLPVVATRAGGIPDAVADGETGFLVPPGDAPAVAEAIGMIFRDDSLALRMGQAGRQRVLDRFNWENTAAVVSRELHSLLAQSEPRAEAA